MGQTRESPKDNNVALQKKDVNRPPKLPGENSEMPVRKEAGYETGQAKRTDFDRRR